MAISPVFSADKMSITDNKVQDQFQQGLVGSYSIVKGHLHQVFHCLQRKWGKRPATNLLSLVENQCKEHHPPIMGMSTIHLCTQNFHCAFIIYLATFAGLDYSRWIFSILATHENHLCSFINMSVLRLHPEKSGAKLPEMERILTKMTILRINRNRDHGSKANILSPLGITSICTDLYGWLHDPEHFLKVGHSVLWIQTWYWIYYGWVAAVMAHETLNLHIRQLSQWMLQ